MVASAVLMATGVLLAACSGGPTATTTPSSTSTSVKVALGTNNPTQGDCTTNTSEAATSVGFVVLDVTPSSFQAEILVQSGPPSTTYGVFLQQVPGSCPQSAANGGMLTTNSTGGGQASASVPRVAGATTFFVQLVSVGSGPPEFTSDRISAA
jgi:hypothetical protein